MVAPARLRFGRGGLDVLVFHSLDPLGGVDPHAAIHSGLGQIRPIILGGEILHISHALYPRHGVDHIDLGIIT